MALTVAQNEHNWHTWLSRMDPEIEQDIGLGEGEEVQCGKDEIFDDFEMVEWEEIADNDSDWVDLGANAADQTPN